MLVSRFHSADGCEEESVTCEPLNLRRFKIGDERAAMETANSTFRELTRKEHEFMARADRDLAARRQQNFINQLKKHPQFKPSMLEPPKPKFKAVSLDNGPIVRTHSRRSECCRHSTPHRHRAAPPLRHHATTSRTSSRRALSAADNGLETKKPYQWGPLGGFY